MSRVLASIQAKQWGQAPELAPPTDPPQTCIRSPVKKQNLYSYFYWEISSFQPITNENWEPDNMIECHFQTWGREVAWQGCDPLRSLSLQPLRRTELDKNWKWMQPLCSFSRRWIFVWADQTGALCPRRSRTGGTTLVHFPEQKIFIQTN